MTAEEYLLSELKDLTISVDPFKPGNLIFKNSDGFVLFYSEAERDKLFHVGYIWSVLANVYNMSFKEIQGLFREVFLKHYNWTLINPIKALVRIILEDSLTWKPCPKDIVLALKHKQSYIQ